MLRITIFIRLIFEVIVLQRISSIQPMRTPKTADFGFSFYAPYEAAVETAFLALCAARMQLEEESTPFAVRSMTFRLKSPASIRDKLTRRGLPQSAEGAAYLHDIAGLRVVLSSVEAVYRFADILRASPSWQFVCARDYIAVPKKSGYRSLHLILEVPIFLAERTQPVRIELQIRTMAMDFWASLEHQLRYKSDVEIPEHVSDDLKKCADVIAETDQEMQRIAKELKVL